MSARSRCEPWFGPRRRPQYDPPPCTPVEIAPLEFGPSPLLGIWDELARLHAWRRELEFGRRARITGIRP